MTSEAGDLHTALTANELKALGLDEKQSGTNPQSPKTGQYLSAKTKKAIVGTRASPLVQHMQNAHAMTHLPPTAPPAQMVAPRQQLPVYPIPTRPVIVAPTNLQVVTYPTTPPRAVPMVVRAPQAMQVSRAMPGYSVVPSAPIQAPVTVSASSPNSYVYPSRTPSNATQYRSLNSVPYAPVPAAPGPVLAGSPIRSPTGQVMISPRTMVGPSPSSGSSVVTPFRTSVTLAAADPQDKVPDIIPLNTTADDVPQEMRFTKHDALMLKVGMLMAGFDWGSDVWATWTYLVDDRMFIFGFFLLMFAILCNAVCWHQLKTYYHVQLTTKEKWLCALGLHTVVADQKCLKHKHKKPRYLTRTKNWHCFLNALPSSIIQIYIILNGLSTSVLFMQVVSVVFSAVSLGRGASSFVLIEFNERQMYEMANDPNFEGVHVEVKAVFGGITALTLALDYISRAFIVLYFILMDPFGASMAFSWIIFSQILECIFVNIVVSKCQRMAMSWWHPTLQMFFGVTTYGTLFRLWIRRPNKNCGCCVFDTVITLFALCELAWVCFWGAFCMLSLVKGVVGVFVLLLYPMFVLVWLFVVLTSCKCAFVIRPINLRVDSV